MTKSINTAHPILQEIHFPLVLEAETSWTLARLSDESSTQVCSITLTESGDLYLEFNENGRYGRYGFDERGNLVSMSLSTPCHSPYLYDLKGEVLTSLRRLTGITAPDSK